MVHPTTDPGTAGGTSRATLASPVLFTAGAFPRSGCGLPSPKEFDEQDHSTFVLCFAPLPAARGGKRPAGLQETARRLASFHLLDIYLTSKE